VLGKELAIKSKFLRRKIQMKKAVATLMLLLISASGSGFADLQCGSETVGELLNQGWRIVKQDYIKTIGNRGSAIILEDGSVYRADMTSGMLAGDRALLLSKYVKSAKAEGYIYNICAGGFDAWVSPIR
jgi:hypothetical protein